MILFLFAAAAAVTVATAAAGTILFYISYRCKKCHSDDADNDKIQNSHFITSSEEQV